jgi:hypothetical protein
MASGLPTKATDALDFTGRFAAALPKTIATPGSVDWHSLPRLIQEIGADALPVTSAAPAGRRHHRFSRGSRSGRFGATVYVQAGRRGTPRAWAARDRHRRGRPVGRGPGVEIAPMKVSES